MTKGWAYCTGPEITHLYEHEDARLCGEFDEYFNMGFPYQRNCVYVEFTTNGAGSDYEGVTVDYCVNDECTGWDLDTIDVFCFWVISVCLTVILGIILSGDEPIIVPNRRDGTPIESKDSSLLCDSPSGVRGSLIKPPVVTCDTADQSPFVRTEPRKSGMILFLLYFIGLHRWYLGMRFPWLFFFTFGGLGYWWALDLYPFIFEFVRYEFAISGWTKKMKAAERAAGGERNDGTAGGLALQSGGDREDSGAEVVAAEILSRPRGMGHSGEARPVFVYTGPLSADGVSPADSLGEAEGYTALLIGANRVNQNNNCWLLTFDSSSDLVVTQSIPCPLSPTLSHFTATRVGGELYVFGGRDSSTKECTNVLSVYTIESGEWRQVEMSGDCPSARYGHTAFALGERLFVGMGLPSNVKPHLSPYDSTSTGKKSRGGCEDFWCYDTQTESWIQIDDPPYTGCFVVSVTVGGPAHLFGGASFNNTGWIDGGRSNFHLTYKESDGWALLADTPFQSAMPGVFKVGSHIHVIRRVKDSPTEVHVYNTQTKEWRRSSDIAIVHGNISCGTITRYRVLLQNEDEMVEAELVGEREREDVQREAERLAASLASLGMPPEVIESAPLTVTLTPLLRDRIETLEAEVNESQARLDSVETRLQKAKREVELLSNPDVHMPEALRLLAEYKASVSLEKEIRSLSYECSMHERELRRMDGEEGEARLAVSQALESKRERLRGLRTKGEEREALRARLEGYVTYPEIAEAL
ncbi:hypothetical protein KIPB_009136 [Kipferlia bialata]|uniref:TM2 domain-containing protein n=1 Tax=Kipferlia bialata TaxID=797122 RepID=A0A9K3D1U3_9EUKA|nr:hypothetical protein KIPB_009136 [Kipferlia bialata]|eukprot:g9136.t1